MRNCFPFSVQRFQDLGGWELGWASSCPRPKGGFQRGLGPRWHVCVWSWQLGQHPFWQCWPKLAEAVWEAGGVWMGCGPSGLGERRSGPCPGPCIGTAGSGQGRGCSLLPTGPSCRLVLGWGGWEPGRGIILVSRVGDSRPHSLEDCPS